MSNNPIPIILIVLLAKNRGSMQLPALNTLELESFLDNARSILRIIDKVGAFSQADLSASLPDMKKIMEVVEKLPL